MDRCNINGSTKSFKKKIKNILKMSNIYKRAIYILAVSELHKRCLYKYITNRDVINLVYNYDEVTYEEVDHSSKFLSFLESKFIQRSHLDTLLKSSTNRYEDIFHAILPSWRKYNHLFNSKNTISNWNITDMIAVRLKLYDIIDDLWVKARLLYTCSLYIGDPILPSFAIYYFPYYFNEIDNVDYDLELALYYLSKFIINTSGKNSKNTKDYIKDFKMEFGSLFKQNLIDIQFNKQDCYLFVSSNEYFIFKTSSSIFSQEELSNYSLENNNLKLVYIYFFYL